MTEKDKIKETLEKIYCDPGGFGTIYETYKDAGHVAGDTTFRMRRCLLRAIPIRQLPEREDLVSAD